VLHRTNRYLNNRIEQDHRGIKGQYQPARAQERLARSQISFDATTNCEISSASVQIVTNMFPPITVGYTFSPVTAISIVKAGRVKDIPRHAERLVYLLAPGLTEPD
jgi:hypothetical protein